MDFKTFLTQLGFSKKESKVYITLLEYGELHVSDLARKARINRVALYEILPLMIEKGIVSIATTGKQKLYRAEDPERLEVLFEKQKIEFDKNIHKLKKIYSREKKRPVIKFREGRQGITDTYIDVATSLPRDAEFYRYSSRKEHGTHTKSVKTYTELRDAKNLQRLLIVGEEKGRQKKKKLDRELRVVPKKQDLFNDDVSQIIYGDKVAFIDYENELSFIIESEKIATFQRKLFKMLYRTL